MMDKGGIVYETFCERYIVLTSIPLALFLILYFSNWIIVLAFALYYVYVYFIYFYTNSIYSKMYFKNEKKQIRLFPDENSSISIFLNNDSIMPIANGKLNFTVDHGLSVEWVNQFNESINELNHTICLDLKPLSHAQVNISIKALKRGIYTFRNISFVAREYFGSSTVYIPSLKKLKTEIIVYPMKMPIRNLTMLTQQWNGYNHTKYSNQLDETSVIGIKRYEKEPFRHIHWKATAKLQTIQAKQFQPIMNKEYTIVVSISDKNGMVLHPDAEIIMSYAVYLCEYLTKHSFTYELFIDYMYQGKICHLKIGQEVNQLGRLLENLARINDSLSFIQHEVFMKQVLLNKEPENHLLHLTATNAPIKLYRLPYFSIGKEGEVKRIGGY